MNKQPITEFSDLLYQMDFYEDRYYLLNNEIESLIENSFQKDTILQHTTFGLHKDDFIFNIDDNALKKFGEFCI